MVKDIWIVLQIKNEAIGTEKLFTDEYNNYLKESRSCIDDPYAGLDFLVLDL